MVLIEESEIQVQGGFQMKRYDLGFNKTSKIQDAIGCLEGKIGSDIIYVIDAETGKLITSTTGNECFLPYDIVDSVSISISSVWDIVKRIVTIFERELIGIGKIELPLGENKLLVVMKTGSLILVVLTTAIPMNTVLITSHVAETTKEIAKLFSKEPAIDEIDTTQPTKPF